MSPSPIKLVCFDLDCTLLNGRLNYSLEQAGVQPGQADPATLDFHLESVGGIKNRHALQKTMRDLLQNGVHVAVTSFSNHPESIPYVLEKIGLTPNEIEQVRNASERPDREARKAFGKNNHIERAIAMFPDQEIKPQEVVLVDDGLNNFELAKKHGYQVVWVQGSEENVKYLDELREMAGLGALKAKPPEPARTGWVDKILSAVGLQRIASASLQ